MSPIYSTVQVAAIATAWETAQVTAYKYNGIYRADESKRKTKLLNPFAVKLPSENVNRSLFLLIPLTFFPLNILFCSSLDIKLSCMCVFVFSLFFSLVCRYVISDKAPLAIITVFTLSRCQMEDERWNS